MQIVCDWMPAPPARWALGELVRTLEARGESIEIVGTPRPGRMAFVGAPSQSPAVREAMSRAGVACPAAPESLLIHRAGSNTLILAGSDERGMVYALTEAARAFELQDRAGDPFDAVADCAESPELPWRSMQLFLCNEKLESEWFYADRFWEGYLGQLARCRYNNLSLTFGHQTSYLAPPYPFLVDMPEFPGVTTPGFSKAEREQKLLALQMISRTAQERGLHVTFAIWSQHAFKYGEPMAHGLTDDILADFNALGLRKVLAACPAVDGVQFRMNAESGIPEDRQTEYYEKQFQVIAECGRPIRLDLRAKGLSNECIERALEIVPDAVVSTKFWCEHLGMPYLMPAIQQFDVHHYRRYGTWDLLKKPRRYRLQHRLWSAGSQRALLWGDPDWVRRFVRACRVGETGFEVMAPLTNKGAGNAPRAWPLFSDTSFQPHEFEYERYWMFYLLFGRLGYSSQTPESVWERELSARFGTAAQPLGKAYCAAGKIPPLITTVLQWSASLWAFWPEMFAGRTLREDADIEPSDPTQFYGVREYVADAVRGRLCGKWTPFRTAAYLRGATSRTNELLEEASRAAREPHDADFKGTLLDLRITALLGEYHADRLVACTHLAFHRATGHIGRLRLAHQFLSSARRHWKALSDLSDGVYWHDLRFGREEFGHCGHWKDRLESIDEECRKLGRRAEETPGGPVGEAPERFAGENPAAARPALRCALPQSVPAGRELTVRTTIEPASHVSQVRCFYRRACQPDPFNAAEMRLGKGGGFEGSIPASEIGPAWDLMVFFEVRLADGEAYRYPDWSQETPYFLITTGGDSVPCSI